MAHELTIRADKKAEMAYVGETPWHGLGQVLQTGADIETWQIAAGMDWTIRRSPVMFQPQRGTKSMSTYKGQDVLFRGDTHEPLGIVSPKYQIVQPYEMLEFFRDLVAGNGFQLETAGTLFGGSRFWALAKVTAATLAGWDKIGGYVLISSTADGSRATEVRETTVRVVCNNTLSMALNAQAKGKITINHRTAFQIDAIQEQMGLSRENFASFIEAANDLTKIKISAAAAKAFVGKLLATNKTQASILTPSDDEARTPRGLVRILELFDGGGKGSEKKGSAGTAWGLVNAVTEYVDHESTAKTLDHRIDKAFWGSGDVLKTKAFEMAQAWE